MAKTDKNILNIGKLYDILSQIKTKISERFTSVDTAIAGRKASGGSSVTNSYNTKTLKKLVLDADGNIVTTGTSKTEFQDIPLATDPASQSSHVSNTQGLVKLQDIINEDEDNTTNAVTPHAVSEAIKGFSSYIDASWILDLCVDYDPDEYHTLFATSSELYDQFMDVMQSIRDSKLVIGNNADGTWVGVGDFSADMHYPGAEWVPLVLISSLDPTVQTNYKLSFAYLDGSIKYKFTTIEFSTEVHWSDIVDPPSITSIVHQEYATSPHDVDTLKFTGDQYYATEVTCDASRHSTPASLGLLVPAPTSSTRKKNNVLKLNSTGQLIWGFPLPSYTANTDSNKVLRVVPNSGGDFADIAWTAETAQVNANWNASSGVAKILNKPTIGYRPYGETDPVEASSFIVDCDSPDDVADIKVNGSSKGTLISGPYATLLNSAINNLPVGQDVRGIYIDSNGTFQECSNSIFVDVTNMTAEEAGQYCDQYQNGVIPYIINNASTIMYLSSRDGTGGGGQSGSFNYNYYRFIGINYSDNKTYCRKLSKYSYTPSGSTEPTTVTYTWDNTVESWYTNFGGVNDITPIVHRFGNSNNGWDWTIPTDALRNYCENYIYIDSRTVTGSFCHEFLWKCTDTGGDGTFTVDLPPLYGHNQVYDFTIVLDNRSGSSVTVVPFAYAHDNIFNAEVGGTSVPTTVSSGYRMLIEVRGRVARTYIVD